MYNLEAAIEDWRKRMLAAGIKTPVPLEELENHLRDEIEQRVGTGATEELAFTWAVRHLGHAVELGAEFNKTNNQFMKQKIIIGVSIIFLLLGVITVLPALGKHNQRNQTTLSPNTSFFSKPWAGDEVYGLMLGTIFTTAGLATILVWRRRERLAADFQPD
jgi:hypothetical protein